MSTDFFAADAAPFWQGCERGELRLKRCASCGAHHHFAPHRCPACLCENLSWVAVSGRGRVASFTVVHRPPTRELKGRTPYVLALIDLAEGARLMAHVEAPPERVSIGAPVRARFAEGPGGRKMPVFDLA